jgi:hypothetical protein
MGLNKTNSEEISDLKVQIYGNTAIATYECAYESTYHGEHRARTILSTHLCPAGRFMETRLRLTALN